MSPEAGRPAVVLACALSIVVGACGGGSQPAGPGTPTAGSGQIHGAVASEKTGAGIPNLIVALLQGGNVVDAVPTAADGQFSFSALDPGSYTVQLTGFDVAGVDLRFVAFTPVAKQVTVADAAVDVPIAAVGLVPARIVGYVRCAGTAQPGVHVRVIGGAEDTTVVTSSIGRYSATNLYAGHYAVIPLDAPCGLAPYQAAETKVGQETDIDFSG